MDLNQFVTLRGERRTLDSDGAWSERTPTEANRFTVLSVKTLSSSEAPHEMWSAQAMPRGVSPHIWPDSLTGFAPGQHHRALAFNPTLPLLVRSSSGLLSRLRAERKLPRQATQAQFAGYRLHGIRRLTTGYDSRGQPVHAPE